MIAGSYCAGECLSTVMVDGSGLWCTWLMKVGGTSKAVLIKKMGKEKKARRMGG